MTREEATKTIVRDYNDGLVCICGGLWGEERIKKSMLAFKALEQEPCEKYIEEIDHLRKYISKLETQIVEQESKTGHLIPIYQGDEIIYYRCSECEFASTKNRMNFCPNCRCCMVKS